MPQFQRHLWQEKHSEQGKIGQLQKANKRFWQYQCLICGTIKSAPGEHFKRKAITSCRKCRPTGKDHWAYNPNTDHNSNKNRQARQWWSNRILEKYNYTCVVCSYRTNLVAHHLYSWHSYKELRLDLNNGVCCCVSCHKKFHKLFGNKNNTKEQFEEFLKLV